MSGSGGWLGCDSSEGWCVGRVTVTVGVKRVERRVETAELLGP